MCTQRILSGAEIPLHFYYKLNHFNRLAFNIRYEQNLWHLILWFNNYLH